MQTLALQTYGERLIQRIRIPAIGVDSPVVAVGWHAEADAPAEWDSPGPAVGWVLTSALPDQNSNIILYGHNNMYGSVFKNLGRLKKGDLLFLQTGQRLWTYQVAQVLLLPILAADEETRQAYGDYLEPTPSARLTVISCWPPESNTHRLLVIADPFASHK